MDNQTIRICFLGYKKLTAIIEDVIRKIEFPGVEFEVQDDCVPENLASKVEDAVLRGCDAFIAGSANAAEFRRISQETLTEIQIHPIDYALAVKKALEIGENPVIYTYRFSKIPDLRFLKDLFGRQVRHQIYEDTYDLTESLEHTDADVIIGSSMVSDIAEKLSYKTVLLYAGPSAVEAAINQCRRTVAHSRRLQGMQELYREMLLSHERGVIGINEDGRVVLYNEIAARITGMHRKQVQGQKASVLFPWAKLEKFGDLTQRVDQSQSRIGDSLFDIEYRRVSISQRASGVLLVLSKSGEKYHSSAQLSSASGRQRWTFGDFDSVSKLMSGCIELGVSYSSLNSPIIISGEAGTGKSLMAMSIHDYASPEEPIELVNCSKIDKRFIMQFFFGRENEDGVVMYRGLLDRCATGTIVLQNIEETPQIFQRNLAQAIRNHVYQRINGIRHERLTARLITVVEDTEPFHFHEKLDPGLYYTLSVLRLEMPPLRKRPEDIPPMFKAFVNKSLPQGAFRAVKPISGILMAYSWPGNIDELTNVAQRFAGMIHMSRAGANHTKALVSAIGEERLWEDIVHSSGGVEEILSSKETLQAFLEKAKEALSYNNSMVASLLGVSRTTLWRMSKDE